MQLFLLAYPWDVADETLGPRLDRLAGEVGVTGLSVWAASPPVVALRAREVTPRVFQSRGGVFFQPGDRHYAGLRAQPIVSTWLRAGDPLKQVAQACASRTLELRTVVSGSAMGRLAERYPELSCRNLFGAESQQRTCLGNAEVQGLLLATCADLSTQFSPSAMVLADFAIGWSDARSDAFRCGPVLGPVEHLLLVTCFCGACVRSAEEAGIDAPGARRTAMRQLQTTLEQGTVEAKPSDEWLSGEPVLASYRRRQVQVLNSLLRRLADACRCPIVLDMTPEATGLASPESAVAATVITPIERSEQLGLAVKTGAPRNEIRLPAWWAMGSRGPQLVGLLPEAARLGIAAVTIDDYGAVPDATLNTLKQAVRFTRRTVSA